MQMGRTTEAGQIFARIASLERSLVSASKQTAGSGIAVFGIY